MNKHRKVIANPGDFLFLAGTGTTMLHAQTKLKNNINFKKFLIGGEPFRYQDGCVFVRALSQIPFLQF